MTNHAERPGDSVNAQVQAPNSHAPGLVANMLWNFAGSLAPLLGAVIAVPLLISNLGLERFGILMIAWMVVGYFNLFDMGLGRALTKLVAERLESGRDNENPGSSGLQWRCCLCLASQAGAACGCSLPGLPETY